MSIETLRNRKNLTILLTSALALALALAWISNGFLSFVAWPSFLAANLFAFGLLIAVWKLLKSSEAPSWLWKLTIFAALLRLAFGVFWLLALPAWGYDTPVQEAGYVMEDAFNRDQVAWELSQSDDALNEAFRGYSSRDQYGGLLYFSAAVYRFIGGPSHQPLLTLVFMAAFSAAAVPLTWAFVKRHWGSSVAKFAAWGLVIYPEAVLLGSSQMREAIGVTLIAGGLLALSLFAERRNWPATLWLALGPLIAFFLSPPFAFALILLLVIAALPIFEWRFFSKKQYWLPALVLLLALGALFFSELSRANWLIEAAEWQAYISRNASGWVARQFDKMPLWAQVPFLLIYGVFRPLLPAAVFADGVTIWRAVAIWRALGWTLLLAMLFYATYLSVRTKNIFKLPGVLLILSWGYTLISSYRGGGDLWDSPRYRSTFAGIQIALAAWAWVQQRETRDPWLRRAIVSAGLMSAWWAPWYLRRYGTLDWPIVEIQHVLGLGLATALLYVIWDWVSA